ncbi:hypothetical protein K435DRAFT_921704 [Dendrothele bispora CBS 962.96]|uniref:GDP-fucose protein O-fucosyltransferase 2 n=1 Tax=Dendrothele bispora (strain CBS 962.96) TaxID=1314807 RepID=A0A4S8MHX6_DENBC|nr:hypothetical protein K435DRAFT_921704 [Dendrothele bispora CBS 962.96]
MAGSFYLLKAKLEEVFESHPSNPYPRYHTTPDDHNPALPPLYEEWIQYERNLPQHFESLPEGNKSKFIFMANHAHGVGWGNVLQEMFLNAYLAYSTNRTFVFDNYTWDRRDSDYSEFKGKTIPSRVPISTMIAGPMIGDPFETEMNASPAVSSEYFRSVCPEPRIIELKDYRPNWKDGLEIMDRWVNEINSIDDPCIEFSRDSPPLFDLWLFFQNRILSLWPSLRSSPIITQFSFSPLIKSALVSNRHLFFPSSHYSFPWDWVDDIPGLMTVHIRRGDFLEFCRELEQVNSDFQGFNAFPEMLDKFNSSEPTERKWEEYRKHCLPSVDEMVHKINEGTPLKKIFVMSNAPKMWLQQLKETLQSSTGTDEKWEEIYTSRDLILTREQKYVSQAVDMYIAEKSQTFVGNGFSSLSSNIMMLRMAKSIDPINSRLW